MHEDVGVGGGVDPAVDVVPGADRHRREVAGDRARGGDRFGQPSERATRRDRTRPAGRRPAGRRRSRARGGQPRPELVEHLRCARGGRSARRAAACWRRRSAGRAHGRRIVRVSSAGDGRRHPRSEVGRADGDGRASSAPSTAAKNAAPARDTGRPSARRRQVGGRHPEPQRGAGDRARRRADDELGASGDPSRPPARGPRARRPGTPGRRCRRRPARVPFVVMADRSTVSPAWRMLRDGTPVGLSAGSPDRRAARPRSRSLRHGLPRRPAARAGGAHLEPVDRDRARGAALVAHARSSRRARGARRAPPSTLRPRRAGTAPGRRGAARPRAARSR